jgi:hypothetical protein
MTNGSDRAVLNTAPKRSPNLCHNRRIKLGRRGTQVAQILAEPLDTKLDLLQLPTARRVTISLPPQLIHRLDLQRRKYRMSRSFFAKCAIKGLLDQIEQLNVREGELETSK